MNRVLLLALLLGFAVPGWATTYYVSSSGSGTTCSSGTPCAPNYAIAHAVGDDIINMQNGTYAGANYMLTIVGRSGSSGHPITIQAVNDGQVIIDGQGARVPIHLEGSYWIIKGVNAHDGLDDVVDFGPGGANNLIQRVCAWNANVSGNVAVIWNYDTTATNNILEDVCAFGTGRKIITASQSGDSHFTVRRAFILWNKTTSGISGATGDELNYVSSDGITENVITTANQDAGATPVGFEAITFERGVNDPSDPSFCTHEQDLGNITYLLNSQTAPTGLVTGFEADQYTTCETIRNNVVYVQPSITVANFFDVSSVPPFSGPSGTRTYANGTEIGPSVAGDTVGASWTVSNRATGTTVGAVPNIWNGGGTTGARVCFQYVNGTLTSTPLWPWPMNQRIIDAMTTAGRTTVDVTATMNSIFGSIPAGCGGVATPDNLVFSSQPTDVASGNNFSPDITVTANLSGGGTDTGFTGNVTLTINGCGASVTGTTTRPAVSGVATFITLGATTFTSGCAFTASATGTNSVVSNTFNVTCAATKLAFTFQPSNAQVGASLGKVAVAIENAGGTICTDNTSIVTITNKGGSCIGMVLGGNAINNAVAGVFTTNNLSESGAGSCILHATDGALTAADSNLFNVSSQVPGPSGRIRTH